jgi:hypothetical protein
MGWIIFYTLCAVAVFYFYKTAKVGYQTKGRFFYGVQKPNKEQSNEEK